MKGTTRKAKTLNEPSLTDSELRYRRLFEAAQDGILILDAETGMIDDVNPYLIKMLGYSRAEFIKKKLWEVGAFKDIDASQVAFETLQENEYIRYEDLPLKTKDGQLIQVEFVSNVYLVGGKKVIQCNIRNVTEHKRIVAALQENEKTYHDLINQSPDGFFVIASSGNILTVNNAICNALEFSQAELLRMNIWDIIPEQYLDQYRKRLEKILSGKSISEEVEYTVQGKDGKTHYVEILSAPHYSGKDIIGFQGIARDITARKRIEKALFESERRFQLASWATKDIIWERNFPANTISWNKNLQRVFNYPVDEIESTVEWWQDHIHPAERIKVINSIQTAVDQGEDFWSKEYRFRLVDGSYADIFDRGYILYNEQGEPLQLVGAMNDITERKRTEQKLVDLAKFPSENPNPVLRLSRDGVVLYANASGDALLGMWGCALGDSAPQFWCDLVAQALASMKSKTVEVECDGKIYSMVVNPVAEPGYANLYGRDITERKQAEKALQVNEAKFRSYIENAPLGLFIADRSGRYVEVNVAASEMLGYTESELLRLSIPDVLAPQSLEAGLQTFQKVVQEGFASAEFLFRQKDGTQFWSTVLATRLGEDRVMSYCQNITERKLAETEIRQRLNELELLYQSGLAFNQLLTPKAIAKKIIDLLDQEMNWHHTAIRLYNLKSQTFELMAISIYPNQNGGKDRKTERGTIKVLSNGPVKVYVAGSISMAKWCAPTI